MDAHFILSKKKVFEQYNLLKNLGVKITYSIKTNKDVAQVLKATDSDFSVHNLKEAECISDVADEKKWFFSQAWNFDELKEIFRKGLRNFVVDNEADLKVLLDFIEKIKERINLALRMKFKENRIHTGKYFVYGMSSNKVNEIISKLKNNEWIKSLGVHIHRKSQNTSEWTIKKELEDTLSSESLKVIKFVNLGGGYPVEYRNYIPEVLDYVFLRIKEVRTWLAEKGVELYLEPGRFIAAPCVNLTAEIIQIYDNNIILNCSIYNSQLDSILTDIRLKVEGELKDEDKDGEYYLIKGCTPTRDDIFRYKVKLKNPKAEDKIVFLNAGAYNYTTEFCDLPKLKTLVVD